MQHKKRILSLLFVLMIVAVPLAISGVSSVHAQGSAIFADDFEYVDSIENHGWTILEGDPHTVVDPEDANNRVVYVNTPPKDSFVRYFYELPLETGMQLSIRFYDTGESCGNCDVTPGVIFYDADGNERLMEAGWYNDASHFIIPHNMSGTWVETYEPYGLRSIGWHTFVWRVEQNGGIDLLIDGTVVHDDLMGPGGTPVATLSRFVVDIGTDPYSYSYMVDDFLVQSPARIAFSSDIDGNYEIYTMDPDGSNRTRITNSDGIDRFPAWSPDGAKIAFASERDGDFEIYAMDAVDTNNDGNGDNLIKFTDNSASDVQPTWSPDGNQIAFISDRDGPEEIYVMYADGSSQTRLTNNPEDYDLPSWSPDGEKIAFSGDDAIYIMDADGNNQTLITSNDGDRHPEWSPDGTRIAFMTKRNYIVEIYVMDVDGNNQTKLTTVYADDSHPTWSPDGSKIAFTSAPAGGSPWQIHVMDAADGSNRTNLSNNSAQEVSPDFSTGTTYNIPNTPTGSPTVDLGNVEVTFANVTGVGTTAVTTSTENQCGATPPGYQAVGFYTDVTTTATYGPGVTVGIQYVEVPNIDENTLKLFHCENGQWVDRTTSVDTANNIVYGQASSLSWFFIGGQWVWIPSAGTGVPVFPSLYVGLATAFGAAIMAYLVRRRLAH